MLNKIKEYIQRRKHDKQFGQYHAYDKPINSSIMKPMMEDKEFKIELEKASKAIGDVFAKCGIPSSMISKTLYHWKDDIESMDTEFTHDREEPNTPCPEGKERICTTSNRGESYIEIDLTEEQIKEQQDYLKEIGHIR